MLFSIELQDEEYHEEDLIKKFAETNPKVTLTNEIDQSAIPIGSVEWCERIYGWREPDYYPDFLKKYLHRHVWKTIYRKENNYDNVFVKPAGNYKLFSGTTKFYGEKCVDGETILWCSEIITFENEWRYYVGDGEVIESAWYDSSVITDDEILLGNPLPDPPELPIELKQILREKKWCGVLDMGWTKHGLTLVESSHGYGVGWYTNSSEKYVGFLIKNDKFLRKPITNDPFYNFVMKKFGENGGKAFHITF